VATATTTPAITLTTSITGLLKGNGTAISAATAGTDYLTSVGLTMPTAFTVTTSPLTANGTLAVTGAGTVAQYIRGDGTLANFPTSGGGGSSLSYYLNGSVTQFGTYKQMNRVPINGAGTNFTLNNTTGYQLMAQFVTDANDPALLNIPAGAWDIGFYFSSSNNTGNPAFYVELLKYDGSTFTTFANNSANAEIISNGTAVDLYNTSLAVSSTSLTVTDRLVIRVYVDTAGSRTITFHTEDNNLAQIITTFTTGLTALNGLTAQVQSFANGSAGTAPAFISSTATHTLNIPLITSLTTGVTAGLISYTDYNNFSNKITNPMTALGDIIYGGTVTSGVAAPTRLGIGTTGQVLAVSGGGVPFWSSAGTGDVTGPASSVDGNFAVFDSTTGKIIKESTGASLSAAGIAVFNTSLALGVGGTTTGQLIFRNSANAFTTTIQASTSAAANLSYTWPQIAPTVGQILSSDASGNLSWTAAGAGDMTLAGTQTVTGTKTFNAGAIRINNATNNGYHILASAAAVSGTLTATFPAATGTVPFLSLAQTFTAAQTFQAGIALNTAGTFTTAAAVASTFSGAATFGASAASAASVIINSAANSSLTNPQLSITSSGGANIQWMSFGTGSTGNPTVISSNRSVGTKIVLYGASGANLDSALGVDGLATGGNLWVTSQNAIKFFADNSTANSGLFRYTSTVRGLNLNATGTALISQLLIDGTNFQWINFGTGNVAVPALLSSARSSGTKIVLYTNGTGLDNALGVDGVAANGNLWLTSPNAIRFFTNDSTTVRATIDSSGLTLAANCSVLMATTGTGGMIGTTTSQLVGFHGTAGTIQRASAAQAAVATTAATLVTPYGYTTAAQADGIITLLNEIRTVLVNKGLMKGSA
jgi:hypothetical protein